MTGDPAAFHAGVARVDLAPTTELDSRVRRRLRPVGRYGASMPARQVDHRPWPLPRGRAWHAQSWRDLLFAHWSFEPDVVRARVPAELELDTFDARAWVGVVPFRMVDVRMFGLPPIPTAGRFCELNVRTYVSYGGKAGVFFFSLDAESRLAVAGGRGVYHLPYYRARMSSRARGDDLEYSSERTHRGAASARFRGRYGPRGPTFVAAGGTLEHWLTERYALYTVPRPGDVRRAEIHHDPWPLQPAGLALADESMIAAAGLTRSEDAPHVLFARRIDVDVWPLARVR